MVLRRFAVVGDKTTTGGVVLPNGNATCTFGGHLVALIGGMATCPACKSMGVIAKAGGPKRIHFMGEVALNRDIVICNCPKPPQIMSALHITSDMDDMDESMGKISPIEARATHLAAVQKENNAGNFDEMPHVKLNGRGLPEHPYYIETADGRKFSGVTDSEGKVPRISSSDESHYTVYWGDDALAKQAEEE